MPSHLPAPSLDNNVQEIVARDYEPAEDDDEYEDEDERDEYEDEDEGMVEDPMEGTKLNIICFLYCGICS